MLSKREWLNLSKNTQKATSMSTHLDRIYQNITCPLMPTLISSLESMKQVISNLITSSVNRYTDN
jgi:hypothetical protein